jgi:hypothetical protein
MIHEAPQHSFRKACQHSNLGKYAVKQSTEKDSNSKSYFSKLQLSPESKQNERLAVLNDK